MTQDKIDKLIKIVSLQRKVIESKTEKVKDEYDLEIEKLEKQVKGLSGEVKDKNEQLEKLATDNGESSSDDEILRLEKLLEGI